MCGCELSRFAAELVLCLEVSCSEYLLFHSMEHETTKFTINMLSVLPMRCSSQQLVTNATECGFVQDWENCQ